MENKMIHKFTVFLVLLLVWTVTMVNTLAANEEDVLSLAGAWGFKLDPENSGLSDRWFSRRLDEVVTLPGTTDENHKGIKKDERCDDRLSRVYYWKGPAWYQRRVTIPQSWKNKRITLLLERTKHTQVWVDNTYYGTRDSLSAPQFYDLTASMTPGKHTLTILVDNSKVPPIGPAHALDERTQTNWNGIIGKIQIRATDLLWLEDIQVYPDVNEKKVQVRAVVGNRTGRTIYAYLEVSASTWNTKRVRKYTRKTIKVRDADNAVQFDYTFDDDVPLWDEFDPAMVRLTVSLRAGTQTEQFRDSKTVDFGMREFVTRRNFMGLRVIYVAR